MFPTISGLVFHILLAAILLILPGLALLRLTVPPRLLDLLSRLVIAPGITVGLTVLIFTWCDLVRLKPGPFLPWLYIIGSLLGLLFVRPIRFKWRFSLNETLAAVALTTILAIFLAVRFRATWGWIVPPGIDTEQHTMIVQLLIEHHGLFQSWAPYSDAESFTYHFGFHAITAVFAWWSHLDGISAVYIMGRVIGAAATASLFALVRLWTRTAWGGVFAVAFWELYSGCLFSYELLGRWVLLAGLTTLFSALVLSSLYFRSGGLLKRWPLGLICAATIGGLALAQYKTAMIFAVLVGCLFVARWLTVIITGQKAPLHRILQISLRILAVVILAMGLAAPRLNSIREAKAGRYLKKIVLEAPAAKTNQFDQPTLSAFGILRSGFETRRKGFVSALGLAGVVLMAMRRRDALWFVAGWAVVTLVMNPGLIGSTRTGLIDEVHWRLAVETAIAVFAGFALGSTYDSLRDTHSALWSTAPFLVVIVISIRGATGLYPLPDWCRYVLPDDLLLMKWIEQNVPPEDLIAGRGFPEHGEILGRDAMMWLPHFTHHRTNHTNLAAGLETGPAELRQKLRDFTQELYRRDMSAPESAQWMQDQGFRWFYVGAAEQDKDSVLLDQLSHNPRLEPAQEHGPARIYYVR